MNAVYVLWIRQLKRYWRSRARVVGSLGQPLLFLVALGFGFGPIFQRAGQGNYIQFLAPGVIGMTILFSAVFSGIELIWDRQFGFLKETLVAPVPRIMIMIGRTCGGATVALAQGMIVIAICYVGRLSRKKYRVAARCACSSWRCWRLCLPRSAPPLLPCSPIFRPSSL